MPFTKGEIIQRHLEGMEFVAEILSISAKTSHVTVRYLDDGNIEEDVEMDEISKYSGEAKYNGPPNAGSNQSSQMKPLAGLVEDDHEVRKNCQPVITVHQCSTEDGAILLNGAENKVAAGGGLRALRYLKK